MSEFIVLGLVPGTQIQITFMAWLIIAFGLFGFWIARLNQRTLAFQGWVIASYIAIKTQQRQF
jgi:hypothetical protein